MTYSCPECRRNGRTPAMLINPGVCGECYASDRLFDADRRLSRAVTSIHSERRWAHLDSGLMPERIGPMSWVLSIAGKERHSSNDYGQLRSMINILDVPRLVITGAESGIGKTSLAVAMMQEVLSHARRACVNCHGDACEQLMSFAECARFVAAIDVGIPLALKTAATASLAVIDDAGQEGRCGGWKGQERYAAIGDMLDTRERNPKRKTIVTTFGNRDQWGQWYGGRVTRLYWDMSTAAVLEMRRAA